MGYVYGYVTHIYLHRVLDVATTLGYHGLTGYHLNPEKIARLAADAMPFEHLAPASCKFLALTTRKRHPTVKSKHCVPSCCFIFWKQYRTSCKYKLSTIILGRSAHSMKATCSNLKHKWWWSIHTLSWKSRMNLFILAHWFHKFQCEWSDSEWCGDDIRIKPPRLEFDLRFAQDDVASQLNLGYLAG